MTLKLMQGFETCRDKIDMALQGTAAITATMVPGFGPSISSPGSFSMRPIGTTISQLYTSGIWGAAGDGCLTYLNPNITVNQAWTAGGATLGFGARFNGGVVASYGTGSTANCCQICFDGTRYWSIQLIGSTYSVAYSTDLRTWTVTASQPTTMDAGTPISYVGGGVVAVGRMTTASTSYTVYYTSNQGATWQSQVLLSGGTSSANYTTGIATGNSSFPNACFTFGTSTTNGVYIGTLGGTMTQVVSATGVTPAGIARPRLNGGILSFIGSTSAGAGAIYSATASNGSLNTTGAWSTATFTGANSVLDMAYNPTSNLWVVAASNGIFTFVNSGSAGTAVAPTGAQTLTQRYSTVGMQNVFWNGTVLVASGLQGHIITSPDGITWTESGGHIISQGVSGTDWRCAIYDGAKYVLCSDSTTGVVATSSDLVSNYALQYVQESAETAISASNTSNMPIGLIMASAAPGSNGQFVLPGGSYNNVGLVVGPQASNQRTLNLQYMTVTSGSVSNGVVMTTNVVTAVPGSYHYFELKYVKVAGTANTFTCALYMDGALIATASSVPLAPTSDTTTLFLAGFQRNGCFTAIDDVYVTLDDGIGYVGPLGSIGVVASRPTTDVSDQWVKNGSAASNSLSVNQPAYSSQSTNYVSSAVAGDKDVYSSANTIPVGYSVMAVSVEAAFTRGGGSAPTVNVGIQSGSTESDSATISVAASGASFASQIYQTDPNGSVAWTNTSAAAAKTVLNHVT